MSSLNPVLRDFTPAESSISFDPLSDDDPLEYEDEDSLANSDSTTASTHSDISHSPVFVDEPVEHEDDEFWISSDSDATPAADSNFATPDIECISLDSPTASDVDMADAGHHSESQIPETEHWSRHAVIRHANDVLFVFQLLSLPDSQDKLTAVLTSISFSRDPAQTARKLLTLLEGTNHVSIYRSEISEVEAWWTETHNGQEPQSDDEMVVAHFAFQSYFHQNDWQLVRKLTCVSVSPRAVAMLTQIAATLMDDHVPTRGRYYRLEHQFISATSPLKHFTCEKSAKAAVSNLHLFLQRTSAVHRSGTASWEWQESSQQMHDASLIWTSLGRTNDSRLLSIISTSSMHRTVRQEAPSMFQPRLKLGPKTQMIGAFLVKKPAFWPQSCPEYCLVVFDQSDIQDLDCMARKVADALSHQSFFQECGRGVPEADRLALTHWSEILSGNKPVASPWPSSS